MVQAPRRPHDHADHDDDHDRRPSPIRRLVATPRHPGRRRQRRRRRRIARHETRHEPPMILASVRDTRYRRKRRGYGATHPPAHIGREVSSKPVERPAHSSQMPTTMTVCRTKGCGRLVPSAGSRRCRDHELEHRARDNARRHRKQDEHGRDTARWRRLSTLARILAGRCQRCGTTDRLTAHLRPELAGNHAAATIDDLTVLCVRCHGIIDGQRSNTRR